ncbi:Hypothetical protein NTJ_10591 [Nesidiocoris tenuis]|uniref:Uncharacterized protein n=1 Tax=Nesidiocoris tenuis TaxID=355587 RepID=A0ABN7B035_9HEMI|nr:Hypothetical protein NTJ_10591 [Nesidiocoris tenuis]
MAQRCSPAGASVSSPTTSYHSSSVCSGRTGSGQTSYPLPYPDSLFEGTRRGSPAIGSRQGTDRVTTAISAPPLLSVEFGAELARDLHALIVVPSCRKLITRLIVCIIRFPACFIKSDWIFIAARF